MAYSRNIDHVIFGKYDIITWFYSPYPPEQVLAGQLTPKLYVCPRCFKYTTSEKVDASHQVPQFQTYLPPVLMCLQAFCLNQKRRLGRLVYRKDNISIRQLDGRKVKAHSPSGSCLFTSF
jgi:histone acetyltransferase MYST1